MQHIRPGIEIVSVADIPGGTGLGSSSSFSVALLNALFDGGSATVDGLTGRLVILWADELTRLRDASVTQTGRPEAAIDNIARFVCDFYTHHDYHTFLAQAA